MEYKYELMSKIYADGGYRGELIDYVKNRCGWDVKITLRTDKLEGFKPLPKRWVVERTFAWLENFRRLAKESIFIVYIMSIYSSDKRVLLWDNQ